MCDRTSSARPRGILSRAALTAAVAAAVESGGTIADLRRDAWGHGLLAIAHAVTLAGAMAVRVDSRLEAEALQLEGIEALVEGDPNIDPRIMYGLPDTDGTFVTPPVLRLAGRVMSTKPLKAGDAVSYGYTYRAATDTRIALVTGGYAQGIMRGLGNNVHVEVGGIQRPIVGRVAMDVCVVDLQGDDEVTEGAEVTYFGGTGPAAPSLSRWSAVTGLTIAELVTVAASHSERWWES